MKRVLAGDGVLPGDSWSSQEPITSLGLFGEEGLTACSVV